MEDTLRSKIDEVKRKRDECRAQCDLLAKELASLEKIERHETLKDVSLDPKSKLIDLLKLRVLDPSPEWRSKIDALISIPEGIATYAPEHEAIDKEIAKQRAVLETIRAETSAHEIQDMEARIRELEGSKPKVASMLTGGDYFEALFQLAFALGITPETQNRKVVFYQIKDYKTVEERKNYLHDKDVNNSGGGEQGIEDFLFRVCSSGSRAEECEASTDTQGSLSYSCGVKPTTAKPNNDAIYYGSVKRFKAEKSPAKAYDIPILQQQMEGILPENKNKTLMVCVRNEEKFRMKLGRTRMDFLKLIIRNNIVGYDSLMVYFDTYRRSFLSKFENPTPEDIAAEVDRLYPISKVYKPVLSLYFHQELVVKSVDKRIQEVPPSEDPHFMCIGVLPRGGKSFIAGGIVDAQRKDKTKPFNVLFLTSAVNETRKQFYDDLIDKFAEFDDFDFIDAVNPKRDPKKKNKFVFVSRQFSTLTTKKQAEEVAQNTSPLNDKDFLKRLESVTGEGVSYDLCFFDEAHVGILSDKVDKNFRDLFKSFNTNRVVLMTATYKKPVGALQIGAKDVFVWDLQDVQDMGSLSDLKVDAFLQKNPDVLQRYPNVAKQLLEHRMRLGQSEESIAKPYLNFPRPNFISLTFTPDTIQKLNDMDTGYRFKDSFECDVDHGVLSDPSRYKEWAGMLAGRSQAIKIRQFLTPVEETGDDFLTNANFRYRALNQIFTIAQKTRSRPLQGQTFSMIMFLPTNIASAPVGALCRIWGSFMMESQYWRDNFVFLTLSKYDPPKKEKQARTPTKRTTLSVKEAVSRGICHREEFGNRDLKELIQEVEYEALQLKNPDGNPKGLVILSGDVAKMGISLPCVDVVCLLNESQEADDIIQKMFRALTDDGPTKKNGFIIDLNVKRIVRAMFEYDIEKSRKSLSGQKTPNIEERIRQLIDLCNWGQYGYIIDNPKTTLEDVMTMIKTRVFDRVQSDIYTTYGDKSFVDKQFDVIQNIPGFKDDARDILEYTKGKRRALPTGDPLLSQGETVPDKPKEEGEKREDVEEKKAAEQQKLTDEEIKKKIVDIMKTFVNAIVIKSDQPWSGMDFSTLITKYMKDKPTSLVTTTNRMEGRFWYNPDPKKPERKFDDEMFADEICGCNTTQECGKMFSNLYDTVFCELRGYAYKQTKLNGSQYDLQLHERIMNLMDKVFAASPELNADWTNYIDSLVKEITSKRLGGGYTHKTKRNKTRVLDKNVRTTQRNKNNTGNHRQTSYSR
jgi:hypothetical protein